MLSKDGIIKSGTLGGLPQFTQYSDNGGGVRLSEINIPIMSRQQNDMSHMSDDDLQFFLGSQGLNNPGSIIEQTGAISTNAQFDQFFPMGLGEKSRSTNSNHGFTGLNKNSIKGDQDLFSIQETDNAAKEVE